LDSPLARVRHRRSRHGVRAYKREDLAASPLSSILSASIISSQRTTLPAVLMRNSGAASTAQASDAQDARIARFSLSVRSLSRTTSIGCAKACAGYKSASRSKPSSRDRLDFAFLESCPTAIPHTLRERWLAQFVSHLSSPVLSGDLRMLDGADFVRLANGFPGLDINATGLHSLRKLKLQFDLEQALIQRSAFYDNIVGEVKTTLE
jgi:hypothetical protein